MKKLLFISAISAILIISFAGCNEPAAKDQNKPAENNVEVNKPNEEAKPGETTKPVENEVKPEETEPARPDETVKQASYATLEEISAAAIKALKDSDLDTLSAMAGEKGVRFSPYSFINAESDVVLTPIVLKNAPILSRTFVWGSYDGSGEPIDLPFGQYYEKFVYDQDFMNAPQIKYNEMIGSGNTVNNLKLVYPDAEFVEYHFPGFDKQYEGMDWESLRLVFEKKDGLYYLVGIVHDGWTI
jgi:hypothetical protein